jgi:hypothetical protein
MGDFLPPLTKLSEQNKLVPTTAQEVPKIVWVLLTNKGGDNAQSISVAKTLGQKTLTRSLVFRPQFELGKPHVRPTLDHVDLQRSDRLFPPWPDLIIVTGRRPSMAALWVKEQSGGHTKIVLIGKPKACFTQFDLVIAAAHYKLPEGRSNVLRIGLPLIEVPADRLDAARRDWAPKFQGLGRPLTVLCFGGSTGARGLDLPAVRHIMHSACKAAPAGTLYILTSRRTPPSAQSEIRTQLPSNGQFYSWKQHDSENPYLGLLALGDRFIVTGDSISMLVEIARLGKPLAIAALPPERSLRGLVKRLGSHLGSGPSRDFDLLHRYLCAQGWAVPLGEEFVTPTSLPPDDREAAAARIRRLLSSG